MLTRPSCSACCTPSLTQKQREKFEEELELDFAYSVPGKARFRVNVYRQRESLGAAFRLIPYEIKPLEALGIPPAVSNFAGLPRGLVLVTGPTGSGKSTTLAGADRPGQPHPARPHHDRRGPDRVPAPAQVAAWSTSARSARTPTPSRNALKHVLRQDPDIILVGEMRDLETISVALTAAETGHLVFATLHTQDAAQTDRPHHRRLPRRAAAAGPHAARRRHPGRRLPDPVQDRRRQGPGRRHRGPGRHAGDPQPDPRGQDPPDLLRACRPAPSTACTRWTSTWPSWCAPTRSRYEARPGEVPPRRGLQPPARPDLRERPACRRQRSSTPVRDRSGKLVKGTLDAENQAPGASAKLRTDGLRARQHQRGQRPG